MLGPLGGMIVAVPILAYAAYEFFVAVNTAGFEAPMPVGVAAAVGGVIAAYNYGEGGATAGARPGGGRVASSGTWWARAAIAPSPTSG